MTNNELKKYIDDKIDSLIILLRERYIPLIINNIWLKSSNKICGDILYKLENVEMMLNKIIDIIRTMEVVE